MSKVQLGASRVAYTKKGNGPGVVLVHGAGASKDTNWAAVTERLEGRFTLVALDYSGSGETVDQDERLELATLAEQVRAVADDAKLESFHLVGYSLGAVVAATVAATHPERIDSLTLIAGWAHSDPRMVLEFGLWRRLFELDREAWVRFAILTGSGPEFFRDATTEQLEGFTRGFMEILPDGLGRQAELITRVDVRAQLSKIVSPTLVVGLTYDQQVPVEHSHYLHHHIRGATYQEIASGHIVPWQHPDAFSSVIEGFLAGQATHLDQVEV